MPDLKRVLFVEEDPDIQTVARMPLAAVGIQGAGVQLRACRRRRCPATWTREPRT